jgi:two-component system, sensor histidine kinase and response regulator
LDINITRAKVNVFERLYFAQHHLMVSLAETERINKQLERFVYLVSHDLKAPLSSVIMLSTMLKKNEIISNNAELLGLVDMIAVSSTRLSEMIKSILEYSKTSLAQQVIEEVDVRQLVTEIVQALILPEKFQVSVLASLPVMETRKIKLQQVFQNLFSNSVKYNDKELPTIEIGATDKGNFYEFYIKDNGPGISKQDQSRIFNLFETTKNQSSGDSSTGIGLNVLKVLVEEQGGKIWVSSEPGEGSTFFFEWTK